MSNLEYGYGQIYGLKLNKFFYRGFNNCTTYNFSKVAEGIDIIEF